MAIREAILAAEERSKQIVAGNIVIDEDEAENSDSENVGNQMLISKRHFNFAMSRARRSVTEKDLALFEEFAEKQKAGRGEAATNFKFASNSNPENAASDDASTADDTTTTDSRSDDNYNIEDDEDDLYA